MDPAHHDAPIRVARIITRLNIGGPAIQAITLSERLTARGMHTLLVHGRLGAGEGDMSYLVPRSPSFDVHYLPALRREVAPASDAAALAVLVRQLTAFQPDVVHTHMAKAGAIGRLAAIVYNRTAGRRRPARIVHTYHGHVLEGYFSRAKERAFTAAERALGRRSDALIAVSPIVHRDLLDAHRIGDAARFHVVPLGFDLDRLSAIDPGDRSDARTALDVPDASEVVSIVGRLTAIKQPDLFLDMAAQVARHRPHALFLIVGGGELEPSLRDRASALGLGDRVRFLGWRRDVAPIYAASDLVALTSRNEGTPVALIESMAAAVPGVAFAVGGVPDVVEASTGVLVPPNDVDALAAGIGDLLRDRDRRAAMGRAARASVVRRFGVDRLVDDIAALYRRLR